MNRKLFVLAISVAGVLVILALVAFAYAPASTATVAPAPVIQSTTQVDQSSTDNVTASTIQFYDEEVESMPVSTLSTHSCGDDDGVGY